MAFNCGAFTEELITSELFGHERGAFTGANRIKKGLLEMADKGTVFFDEIGELPFSMQVKLLRVLQERTLSAGRGNRRNSDRYQSTGGNQQGSEKGGRRGRLQD